MPKLDHPNIGDVLKYVYLQGVITSVNSGDDTAGVSIPSIGMTAGNVPIFYHCTPDAVLRDNGALEGASGAFSEDDEVIVRCEILDGATYKADRVMGFKDKPKVCYIPVILIVYTETSPDKTIVWDVENDCLFVLYDDDGNIISQPNTQAIVLSAKNLPGDQNRDLAFSGYEDNIDGTAEEYLFYGYWPDYEDSDFKSSSIPSMPDSVSSISLSEYASLYCDWAGATTLWIPYCKLPNDETKQFFWLWQVQDYSMVYNENGGYITTKVVTVSTYDTWNNSINMVCETDCYCTLPQYTVGYPITIRKNDEVFPNIADNYCMNKNCMAKNLYCGDTPKADYSYDMGLCTYRGTAIIKTQFSWKSMNKDYEGILNAYPNYFWWQNDQHWQLVDESETKVGDFKLWAQTKRTAIGDSEDEANYDYNWSVFSELNMVSILSYFPSDALENTSKFETKLRIP